MLMLCSFNSERLIQIKFKISLLKIQYVPLISWGHVERENAPIWSRVIRMNLVKTNDSLCCYPHLANAIFLTAC